MLVPLILTPRMNTKENSRKISYPLSGSLHSLTVVSRRKYCAFYMYSADAQVHGAQKKGKHVHGYVPPGIQLSECVHEGSAVICVWLPKAPKAPVLYSRRMIALESGMLILISFGVSS